MLLLSGLPLRSPYILLNTQLTTVSSCAHAQNHVEESIREIQASGKHEGNQSLHEGKWNWVQASGWWRQEGGCRQYGSWVPGKSSIAWRGRICHLSPLWQLLHARHATMESRNDLTLSRAAAQYLQGSAAKALTSDKAASVWISGAQHSPLVKSDGESPVTNSFLLALQTRKRQESAEWMNKWFVYFSFLKCWLRRAHRWRKGRSGKNAAAAHWYWGWKRVKERQRDREKNTVQLKSGRIMPS